MEYEKYKWNSSIQSHIRTVVFVSQGYCISWLLRYCNVCHLVILYCQSLFNLTKNYASQCPCFNCIFLKIKNDQNDHNEQNDQNDQDDQDAEHVKHV